MSKGTLSTFRAFLPALAALLGACAGPDDTPRFTDLPAGRFVMGSRVSGEATSERDVAAFRMARTETTARQFVRYLNATRVDFASPQVRRSGDVYEAVRPGDPIAHVDYGQARAYVAWLAGELRVGADLPTEAEWEYAARAGVHGAPFPWGWGDAKRRARFRADGVARAGSFPPNRFGLCDLAGNVAEWCRADDASSPDAPVRGGSWADRSEDRLRVDRRARFARDYRDADVGFRVVIRD